MESPGKPLMKNWFLGKFRGAAAHSEVTVVIRQLLIDRVAKLGNGCDGQIGAAKRSLQNGTISRFPKPLSTERLKRLRAATSIYATFRPLFRLGSRWSASIPSEASRGVFLQPISTA